MEKCAEDFIDLMTILRDPQGEVPEFQDTMYRWAIECKNKALKNVLIGVLNPMLFDQEIMYIFAFRTLLLAENVVRRTYFKQ